ncbi:hypothetical protein BGZ76_008917, partial [Entomortierella beljakovae]
PALPGASLPVNGGVTEEIFHLVMICTRYPSFEGMQPDDGESYTGIQMHAHYCRKPDELKGTNVVIVGLGSTATDIAVELLLNQSQVHLSRRSPIWPCPQWLLKKPLDYLSRRILAWTPFAIMDAIIGFLVWMVSVKI